MNKTKKILLVNFGGIGDEILFLPVVKSLKKKFPDSEITLCLEPRSKGILSLCKDIDKVILADIKSSKKYFELLKFCFKAFFSRFDLAVSSGSNKFIPILLFLTGAKERIGYDCGSISTKFLTKAVKLNNKQYAGKMYHDLVADLTGEEYQNPVLETDASKDTDGMVLIHPGVSQMSIRKNIFKSYGSEKWAELAEILIQKGEKVALAGGPDDDECIKDILKYLKEKNLEINNFYGKTKNLSELASLMKGAKAVICCDSAPMHIAVAMNVKTIAIFGPTDEKKLVPEKENVFVVKADCDCRPCLWDKRQTSCEEKYCLNFSNEEICKLI